MHQEITLKAVVQMAIKIGHASIDERGKISGGKIGDQTGKEICIRSWYSKPWNVYIECTDKALADKAAKIMEEICKNDSYGYDQVERWTGYNAIKKNKNKVSGAAGEFDCSSLIITCYILAGLQMSADGYTGNLKAKLLATGKFKAYTDPAHLTTDKYAKRGSIYLKEGSHVVMALEDGEAYAYPEPTRTIYYDSTNKRIICKGEDVKWVQQKLGVDVDGECGPKTDKVIREFQKKNGLEVDGRVGPLTRAKLKSINK